jgi:hypothetical protein
MVTMVSKEFERFPNDSEDHKKLNDVNWFNTADYSYVPTKVVLTLEYTLHCVSNCINKDNWLKEITDYIDYTVISYGELPKGFGLPVGLDLYLNNVFKNIEVTDVLPEQRKHKILDFINQYYAPVTTYLPSDDLNDLIEIYKKWVKHFPFDLSFFSHLKDHYENQLHIAKETTIERNIYLPGPYTVRLKTRKELIEFLTNLTGRIITEINSLHLYEMGLISDLQKIQIEVIKASRRMEMKQLSDKATVERKEYIKVLNEWFKGEKKFLKELASATA